MLHMQPLINLLHLACCFDVVIRRWQGWASFCYRVKESKARYIPHLAACFRVFICKNHNTQVVLETITNRVRKSYLNISYVSSYGLQCAFP